MSKLTDLKNRYMDEQSDENAYALMKQLYASDLYVPFDLSEDHIHHLSLPSARIIHAGNASYRCLLAFSDEKEVEDEWSKNFAWTTMRFQQLADLTEAAKDIPCIALDPLTDTMIITQAMIADYHAGRLGS